MNDETPKRSDSSRIAVAVLGAVIVLGGAYGLTRPHEKRNEATTTPPADGEPPALFAVGAAAASGSRGLDIVGDERDEQSPTMRACRDLQRAKVVHDCVPDDARAYHVGELTRFMDERGSESGYVTRLNGGTSIESIVAATIQAKHATRPCDVVGSPGSRMVAVLEPSLSCEVAPKVRAALDRQSTVTMLACLELVDAGLVSQCESTGSLDPVGDDQGTLWLDEHGEFTGGYIERFGRAANIEDKVSEVRNKESHKFRPCEVVGSQSAHMIAVLPPLLSCDHVQQVRAAMDHFLLRDQ